MKSEQHYVPTSSALRFVVEAGQQRWVYLSVCLSVCLNILTSSAYRFVVAAGQQRRVGRTAVGASAGDIYQDSY